jgi:hypothetical protein
VGIGASNASPERTIKSPAVSPASSVTSSIVSGSELPLRSRSTRSAATGPIARAASASMPWARTSTGAECEVSERIHSAAFEVP